MVEKPVEPFSLKSTYAILIMLPLLLKLSEFA